MSAAIFRSCGAGFWLGASSRGAKESTPLHVRGKKNKNSTDPSILGMASTRVGAARGVPALLVAGFALLAVAMVGIHQQGRAVSLLQIRARRASLHAKMDSFFALLKHPVRTRPTQPPRRV
jgi:hypothetical protein